jgi:general secretion pathway protein G
MRLTRTAERGGVVTSARAGFTLVEMLVVLVILGLIMGLVGPRVLNYLTDSREKAARIQIESFKSSLDLFFLDTGRYPTTAEGLAALVRRPGGLDGWNGPYLRGGNLPADPWGRAYAYRSPADKNPFEITTLGPQGGSGSGQARPPQR